MNIKRQKNSRTTLMLRALMRKMGIVSCGSCPQDELCSALEQWYTQAFLAAEREPGVSACPGVPWACWVLPWIVSWLHLVGWRVFPHEGWSCHLVRKASCSESQLSCPQVEAKHQSDNEFRGPHLILCFTRWQEPPWYMSASLRLGNQVCDDWVIPATWLS